LKAPGAKRPKLKYDAPLSKLAVKINVCRYAVEMHHGGVVQADPMEPTLEAPVFKPLKH
jgi:hypothetical protein